MGVCGGGERRGGGVGAQVQPGPTDEDDPLIAEVRDDPLVAKA